MRAFGGLGHLGFSFFFFFFFFGTAVGAVTSEA